MHKCSTGLFFWNVVYHKQYHCLPPSPFLLCTDERFRPHLKKNQTHQLNLSVLSMILSTFTSIMQKCSSHFCLALSACRSSGDLTCFGQAVGMALGMESSAAAPGPPCCSCSNGQTGEGASPPCAVSWPCCPSSGFQQCSSYICLCKICLV